MKKDDGNGDDGRFDRDAAFAARDEGMELVESHNKLWMRWAERIIVDTFPLHWEGLSERFWPSVEALIGRPPGNYRCKGRLVDIMKRKGFFEDIGHDTCESVKNRGTEGKVIRKLVMNAHSAILGGSNAARLLNCPASYAESLRSPLTDIESVYAAEGTALHQAIAHCIESKVKPAHIVDGIFYGHVITDAHVTVLEQALFSLDELLARYGKPSSFRLVGVEETLPLPGVTGAFGSVDLIMANKRTVVVIDWKFGQGIKVEAAYPVEGQPNLEELNPQLAYYAVAAEAAHPRNFKDKQIVLAVIQPRIAPFVSYAETTAEDLAAFQSAFVHAYSEALGRNAYRERGEWCRFAPCKATCPLWTGAVISLADIDPLRAALQESTDPDPTEYGNFLSTALSLAEIAETWAEEIRKQGHLYLESGGRVPGFKLVPKRASRKWCDEATVAAELFNMGAEDDDMFNPPSLKSPAQMEKALKPRGIVVPADMYQAISSGTTIAHEDDARPDATHDQLTDEFRAALKAL